MAQKIIDIKRLCPRSNIIVAPILPSRIRALNDRAKAFNNMLFSCRNPFWQTLGFNSFLDDDDLLDSNFTRPFNTSTGYRDRIHLERRGISRLGLLIRDAVLQPGINANRSYANVTRGHVFSNHKSKT